MDAEIAALEAEIAAAKTKTPNAVNAKDADIAAYQTLPYASF